MTDNRHFGILIQDGSNQTSNNKISGGNVGIAAAAINANALVISQDDDISGTAVAPVRTFSLLRVYRRSPAERERRLDGGFY